MRDKRTTNKQTLKIELLSQWKLEAEFRKMLCYLKCWNVVGYFANRDKLLN